MRALPPNPAGLKDRHLADTRRALLSIITNRNADPLDRVRAAKEIRGWANDVWKWNADRNSGTGGELDTEIEKPVDPLAGLKVVG